MSKGKGKRSFSPLQRLSPSLPICPNPDITHIPHGLPPLWKGQESHALLAALG